MKKSMTKSPFYKKLYAQARCRKLALLYCEITGKPFEEDKEHEYYKEAKRVEPKRKLAVRMTPSQNCD